jgi:hypothetical protein
MSVGLLLMVVDALFWTPSSIIVGLLEAKIVPERTRSPVEARVSSKFALHLTMLPHWCLQRHALRQIDMHGGLLSDPWSSGSSQDVNPSDPVVSRLQ